MQINILTFAVMTVTHPRLINHDGVEQATTADLLDAGAALHGSQAGAELHSPCRGILGEILVAQDLHRRHCHLACQRVAPVRRAVFARFYCEHYFVRGEDRRDRKDSAGESL